jgi:lipoprotein-anchoring transpeptidase ErfK/SrfK
VTLGFREHGRGGLPTAAAVLCLLVLAAFAMLAGTAAARPVPRYPVVARLDSPGHASRYAHLNAPATVRLMADWHAPHVAKLGMKTEDGTDEVVLVLGRSKDHEGALWIKIRVPVTAGTGWVPRSALGEIRRIDTWLRVDRARLRMTLVKAGKVVFSAPVGIGRPQWPTPKGEFYIRDRLAGAALGQIYGPLAFGTSARSAVLTDWPGGGVIGIHGTDEPGLLPGRVSHGCIRLRNADILRLGRMLPIGTPVTIF